MYIVDKNKDYYDYLSHIYGIDKKVVFDRRGSTIITDENFYNMFRWDFEDSMKYYNNKDRFFLLLEIGDVQHLIEVLDTKAVKDSCNCNQFKSLKLKVLHSYHDHKHYYDSIISIRKVSLPYFFKWSAKESCKRYIINDSFTETIESFDKNSIINLPILSGTQLTSLIDGNELWIGLQNYISSLNNDEDCDTDMTDVERASTHGFDKKSFRNPIR